MSALKEGNYSQMQSILDSGFDINAQNDVSLNFVSCFMLHGVKIYLLFCCTHHTAQGGYTALMLAVSSDFVEGARFLIKHGANLDIFSTQVH